MREFGIRMQRDATNQYDALNRRTSTVSTPSGTGTLPVSYAYQYNSANQRTHATLQDGSYWDYLYDNLGQVISGIRYWSNGVAVAGQNFEYDFDDIGNRTTTGGRASAVSTYNANALNQYTGHTVAGAVDVLGAGNSNAPITVNNRITARKGEYFHLALPVENTNAPVNVVIETIAHGMSNNGKTGQVYVAKSPETFQYDADGNLINDGRWTYTWDAENRLMQMVALASVPAESKLKLLFDYDWQGRRIQKRVYTWNTGLSAYNSSPITSIRYLNDGWNLVAELAPDNTKIRSYLWGLDFSGSVHGAGGVGGLTLINDATNGVHFAAYDGNGNLAALVKYDGTVSALYEYGPFGELLRATGPMAALNPFRFSTKYQDDETGLLYYGYRYYVPRIGRWLSRDSIGENGGINRYCFLQNAPIAIVDILGNVSLNPSSIISGNV